MKNVIGKIAAALMAAGIMAAQAVTVCADSDVTLDCTSAIESDNWSQSVKFGYNSEDPADTASFDATRMTENSVIKVSYDIIEDHQLDETQATGYPVELIFQSWSNPDTPMVGTDGGVWAKVAPAKIDTENNTEEFNYADIVAAYGSDNFEKVDCVLFGSTNDAKILVKSATVTNCKDEGSHWVDPSIAEQEKAATKKNIVGIVVGIVAGIAVAVGVIWFIISRKSREAFDVTTGEFVDKKDAR
ncbi:hypothetical protein [Ruminococcus sp.]|uniref:hypothetical protein n=1 Tax=Ruminococcus sp. TaxID=41978 RepID=UPI0025D7318B|nr:hypothetical protein [Ruminococcus sp.]MBQ8965457.1 hypothetical protein [Ruminococcus sp.]